MLGAFEQHIRVDHLILRRSILLTQQVVEQALRREGEQMFFNPFL